MPLPPTVFPWVPERGRAWIASALWIVQVSGFFVLAVCIAMLVGVLVWHMHFRPEPVRFIATDMPYPLPADGARADAVPMVVPGGEIAFERRMVVTDAVIGLRLVRWLCAGVVHGRHSSSIGYIRNGGGVVTEVVTLAVPATVPAGVCRVDIALVLDRPPFRRDVIHAPPFDVRVEEPPPAAADAPRSLLDAVR